MVKYFQNNFQLYHEGQVSNLSLSCVFNRFYSQTICFFIFILVSNGGTDVTGVFDISQSDGHITLIDDLDYESLVDPRQYIITVLAIDGGELTVMKLMSDLGDNCIQNFHLGRYIVGYTVGNLVLRRRASRAVKHDFQTYIRGYTSPNENFEYGYPHSKALLLFRLKLERWKPHKAAHH